jgi:hypothetical protein
MADQTSEMKALRKQTLDMREYLLGTVNEESASAIDERCLSDREGRLAFWEAEAQLIEDYVLDRLDQPDRLAFERHYMSTARNQEHVALIAGLATASRRSNFPTARPLPRIWLATAAIVLISAGVSSWSVWQLGLRMSESSRDQMVLAQRESQLREAHTQLIATARNRLAVFQVDDTRRGEAARSITVPSGATEVTLVIPRDVGLPEPATASISREGPASRTPLDAPRVYVPKDLPFALVYIDARVLTPGTYYIQLQNQRSFRLGVSRN